MSGLDAGPLNAFLSSGNQRPLQGSGNFSCDRSISSAPASESFYVKRKERQDEIMEAALKERWENKDQKKDSDVKDAFDNNGDITDGEGGDDDDQPKVKKKHKTPLAHLKKGLSKTAKTTKGVAKGSVNAVRDPKAAAKKVQGTAKKVRGFAQDIGKETGKMILDPRLAAKTAVSFGKDGLGAGFKVGQKVGTGVAKGSLGLTKTVAMTGVGAAGMVVGTALDGAGKVVNIFLGDLEEEEEGVAEYDARDLPSRRKALSLLDRVSSVTDRVSSVIHNKLDDSTTTPQEPSPSKRSLNSSLRGMERNSSLREMERNSSLRGMERMSTNSMLVPMATTRGSTSSGWDL
jgi:hypothetical protein